MGAKQVQWFRVISYLVVYSCYPLLLVIHCRYSLFSLRYLHSSDHILICMLNFLPSTSVFDSSRSYTWGSRIAYGLRSSWMIENVIPDAGLDCSVISNWLFNIVNSFFLCNSCPAFQNSKSTNCVSASKKIIVMSSFP